jgi:hypothetical protein
MNKIRINICVYFLTPITKNIEKNNNFEAWELDPRSLKY